MLLNKNSYNSLLDALDIMRLHDVLEQLKCSQDKIEPLLSPLRLANLDQIKHVYRDISDDGIIRSHYLMCFEAVSANIQSLSTHANSIKNAFANFAWDSVEKISETFESSIINERYEEYDEYKKCVDLDLEELILRIEYIRDIILYTREGVAEILPSCYIPENYNSDIREIYKQLKFTHEGTTIEGLPNIRKITEPNLDFDKFEQIQSLISKIEQCNAETNEGRAAILAITFMIGEIGKTISDQTKNINPKLPLKQLQQFRDKIHDLDTISKAHALLHLVERDADHLQTIKDFIVIELKAIIESVTIPNIVTSEPMNKHNPIPTIVINCKHPDNSQILEKVKEVVEIIRQSLPASARGSETAVFKIDIFEKILSGQVPLPINQNLYGLFFDIMRDEVNTLRDAGSHLQDFDRALYTNHDALSYKNHKKVKEDIKLLKEFVKSPVYQYVAVVRAECAAQDIMCLREIENELDSIQVSLPKPNKEQYIQNQLELLIGSLEQISIHTNTVLQTTTNYQEARDACTAVEFHFFHLFHLIVIGQAIQNLMGKEEFIKHATASLLEEFEFLKWVRNGLMHNKEIDETGSLFDYFKNDLLDLNLKEHGARAYDSNEYLQYIKPLITKTLANIQHAHVDDDHASCEEQFIQSLMYKQLEMAYKNGDDMSAALILQALGNTLDENINIHAQAGKVLQSNPILDLGGYTAPQISGLEMLPQTKINGFLEHKEQILEFASSYKINILGLFGNIVQNGFAVKYEEIGMASPNQIESSGLLVENKGSDAELALFKQKLSSVLQHRLLVVTTNHIAEYLNNQFDTLDQEGVEDLRETQIRSEISEHCKVIKNNSMERLESSMRLLRAVENKTCSTEIEELLQTYTNINLNLKYHGYTSLHRTCHVNSMNYETFVLLIKYGADVNTRDKRDNTVAHYIASGQVGDEWDVLGSLTLLAEYGFDFNLVNAQGNTPLQSASEHYNQCPEVYHFLLQRTDLPIAEKLIQAIKQEVLEDVQRFLAEIVSKRRSVTVETLNTETDKYGLIGNIACGVGNREIINLLASTWCDLTLIAEDGTTALDIACYADNANYLNVEDRLSLITWLIDDVKINITSTAIHNALYCWDLEILRLLLHRGGNLDSVDGMTPLLSLINQTCTDDHTVEVIELLLEYGANILAVDGYVGNSLHLAAERGHIQVAELLLNHAYRINQLPQLLQPSPEECYVCRGLNAYKIAQRYGHVEIIELLSEYFTGTGSLIINTEDVPLIEIHENFDDI